MTRGMLVTVLHRLAKLPVVSGSASFNDIPQDAYYKDAVNWAAQAGIVSGVSADAFGPGGNITREQLAAMVYRYAGTTEVVSADFTVLDGYSDAAGISPYAREAMAWCVENGIISGVGNRMLLPKSNATRAQVASILQRFSNTLTQK